MKIGIINLGYGNLFSIMYSIKKILKKKDRVLFLKNINKTKKVDKIIFPGNGSIFDCFFKIKKLNFLFLLRKYLTKTKKPFLGICLGKQIFFNFNYEGNTNGLGVFKGNILKIKSNKVPNIGWSKINILHKHRLIKKIKSFNFYFSHSYYLDIKKNTFSNIKYYKTKISSIFIKKNFFLLQFHPEKSSYDGVRIMKNFIYDNTSFRYIQ